MIKQKLKREFSAGGVVYKKLKIRWLICKHSGYKKWVFPKGLIDKGETSEKTAVREVEEETGVKAKIIEKIPEEITYFYFFGGERIFKKVVYFLMEYVSGDMKNHDFEMEEVEWVDYNEAKKRLGFESDRKVLEKAKEMIMAR